MLRSGWHDRQDLAPTELHTTAEARAHVTNELEIGGRVDGPALATEWQRVTEVREVEPLRPAVHVRHDVLALGARRGLCVRHPQRARGDDLHVETLREGARHR